MTLLISKSEWTRDPFRREYTLVRMGIYFLRS